MFKKGIKKGMRSIWFDKLTTNGLKILIIFVKFIKFFQSVRPELVKGYERRKDKYQRNRSEKICIDVTCIWVHNRMS